MILILDEVLSSDECSKLIKIYNDNKEYAHIHGTPKTYPLYIQDIQNNKDTVITAAEKIKEAINQFLGNKLISITTAIVKWPENSSQDYHVDITDNGIVYELSSVAYLNEDFNGGCLQMIDGTKIRPKVGRLVVFDGRSYMHSVELVQNNDRYTLPIWYKLD
jgi:hypothetical protein